MRALCHLSLVYGATGCGLLEGRSAAPDTLVRDADRAEADSTAGSPSPTDPARMVEMTFLRPAGACILGSSSDTDEFYSMCWEVALSPPMAQYKLLAIGHKELPLAYHGTTICTDAKQFSVDGIGMLYWSGDFPVPNGPCL